MAAENPKNSYASLGKVERIVIHHSATPVKQFNGSKTIQSIQKYHISKGWNDIGYHFLISPNGSEVYEGRPLWALGAHCGIAKDEAVSNRVFGNAGSIGICLIGNYDTDIPQKEALLTLNTLISRLIKETHIDKQSVFGHCEAWKSSPCKTCPGKNLFIELFGKSRWEKLFKGKPERSRKC